MIWVHCGDKSEVITTLSLATRLHEHSDAMDVVVTAGADILSLLTPVPDGVQVVHIPQDSVVKARAFLAEWAPQYLIWNGGPARPILLRCVEKSGLGATMINARNSTLFAGRSRWMPGASRNAVLPFNRVLTADGATATRLIRGGVPREKVVATGPILEEPLTLPHDANELTVLIEALSARPLWFAASVTTPEIVHIVAAHLTASRKNHRLLLLITPRDIDSGPNVAQVLREAGFKVGVRSQGDDPEPEHQAYVADLDDELGLWYRIAPLTFIGGTLSAGGAISPFEPIALGSAVIHGPRKSPHAARFARLAQAQASRKIRSAAELGIAVGVLISPEQTARMALAGWSEITQNAETINQLVLDALQSTEVAR
jgi:3-deoxy-D-manno-octulosonic-acid transferase